MKRLLVVAVAALGLLSAGVADAAWLADGTGQGTAVAGTLVAPASATASASGSTVTVTWPAAVGAPAGSSYVVTRSPADVVVCATASTTCTDTGVADGMYSYSVRTVAGSAWASAWVTSNSVTITTAPPAATTFSIAGLDGLSTHVGGSDWTPGTTVTVRDNQSNLVSGAMVSFSWTATKNAGKKGEDTVSGTASCTTDATGTCLADVSTTAAPTIDKQYSPATFTVTSALHGTLLYKPVDNAVNAISVDY